MLILSFYKFYNKMMWEKKTLKNLYCVKSVQIQSLFWSVLYRIRTEYGDSLRKSVLIRENTGQKKLRIWTIFMGKWITQYS